MNKTNYYECDNKLTVDIKGLQAMLSLGRNSANRIAEAAGAVVRVGRRKLYNVKKIEAYLSTIMEV